MTAETQIAAVLACATEPLALHEIQRRIFESFGVMHETTSISIRLRSDVRPKFEARGVDLLNKPKAKYIRKHVYWLQNRITGATCYRAML